MHFSEQDVSPKDNPIASVISSPISSHGTPFYTCICYESDRDLSEFDNNKLNMTT
jgi:hypothetical protein